VEPVAGRTIVAVDEEPSTVLPPDPVGPTPRQVRARRRRRRRQIGTALFVVVAAAVFLTAFVVVSGGDDGSDDRATASTTAPSTTAPVPRGPYQVTTGVNVRQSPATSAPVVGLIETGHEVFVACVTEGQVVEGPNGPIAEWLRIVGFGPNGYLTALYVDVGDDLRTDAIPPCESS
jgi:hypothetical protein